MAQDVATNDVAALPKGIRLFLEIAREARERAEGETNTADGGGARGS